MIEQYSDNTCERAHLSQNASELQRNCDKQDWSHAKQLCCEETRQPGTHEGIGQHDSMDENCTKVSRMGWSTKIIGLCQERGPRSNPPQKRHVANKHLPATSLMSDCCSAKYGGALERHLMQN